MKFLCITFYRQPNGQINEQVVVSKNLKSSDLSTCNIIMNFQDKVVQKCVIENESKKIPWDTMVDYYKKIYPNLVEQLQKDNVPKKSANLAPSEEKGI